MQEKTSSTRIKDAGIAIRHSRGRTLFYTAGSRNGSEGWAVVGKCTKKKLYLRERRCFVIEKHVEDVKQGQKVDSDMLESLRKPTRLVKEELRLSVSKLSQFRPKITKIKVCTFEMSVKITD